MRTISKLLQASPPVLTLMPGGPVAAEDVARFAGLTYINDDQAGYSRRSIANAFRYFDANGKSIRDETIVQRINKLGIPPAWIDVWICSLPNGHLQATGRDSKGRKQYRYHEKWRAVRDETKFSRMTAFALALPKIRKRIETDLSLPGLPRDKVIAGVVRLLDTTGIRIGNDEYARTNQSFGLTTMRCRHVKVEGSKIHFEFRGKSSKNHSIDVADRKIARLVKRCQELPGYELFQYLDEGGGKHRVTSDDVNQYLKDTAGDYFTAKDFRTWAGTVMATRSLCELRNQSPDTRHKQLIDATVRFVAEHLGNTPTVCRKYYIHPAFIDLTKEERVAEMVTVMSLGKWTDIGLRSEEHCVLELLNNWMSDAQTPTKQKRVGKSAQKSRIIARA